VALLARVIVVDVPHHVTQRGNARQVILTNDADRAIYLDLLRRYTDLHQLSLLGYCLMSNHVHLIVVPRKADSLAQTLKHAHGSYASYWNVNHSSSGHVWQGRYYSCPLDSAHLWAALRYTELNPVRAGLVRTAEEWKWSSADAHCAAAVDDLLEMKTWRSRWNASEWREYLTGEETETELKSLRQSTHTGRPLGSPEFVEALEKSMHRSLAPRAAGRPTKPSADARQSAFAFKL
jgi:putative transposase